MSDEEFQVPWLDLMGIAVGEEIVIIPRAGQPGQGFQGFLVEAVFSQSGPVLLVIQESAESAKVTIPWDAVLMITKPNPQVEAAVAAAKEEHKDISVTDLIEMTKAMGIDTPPEIQALADAE